MWIGSLKKSSPIQIIGCGISGLLVAYQLKKAGLQFNLWDIADKTGGKIQSISTPYGLIETAANAIILDQYGKELLHELELVPLFAKPKLTRWIVVKNSWFSHWSIFFKLSTSLLFKGFKNAPYLEEHKPNTLEKFFIPLMGYSWSHNDLSAISRGIYAKNSFELTLESFFNINFLKSCGEKKLNYFQFFYTFIKYKKKNKSYGSISFSNGLQELIDALTHEVKDHLNLETSFEKIKEVVKMDNILFCTPAKQTANYLENSYPELAKKFSAIPSTDVQSLTLFTSKPFATLKNSFGVLLTPYSKYQFFGVLAQSEIFIHRTKDTDTYCYTLIGPIIDDNIVLDSFCSFSQLHRTDILYFQKHSWPNAIPVYNHIRLELVEQITKSCPPNMAYFGNYIEAIGLKDLIRGANSLVKAIQS